MDGIENIVTVSDNYGITIPFDSNHKFAFEAEAGLVNTIGKGQQIILIYIQPSIREEPQRQLLAE